MMRKTVSLAVTAVVTLFAALLVGNVAYGTERNPVIFVHGFLGNSKNFDDMVEDFKADGYAGDELYTLGYDDTQSNVKTASELNTLVNQVLDRTGASKVDIVAHSMGSLSSRYFLKFLGGTDRVDEWVSLGGPNHGTNTAYTCLFNQSCKEMAPNSPFLRKLNSGDETPGDVRYGTFWSSCDELINPDSSTPLSGATNTYVGCVEHFKLNHSDNVSKKVRAFVK